jgi:hypothetical protein
MSSDVWCIKYAKNAESSCNHLTIGLFSRSTGMAILDDTRLSY